MTELLTPEATEASKTAAVAINIPEETSDEENNSDSSAMAKDPAKAKPKIEAKTEDAGQKKPKKRIATTKNPTIEAVTHGLFRFKTEEQALKRLATMRDFFVVSVKLPQEEDGKSLKLWIRGFKVSKSEMDEGYLGNYALVKPVKTKDKKWTLKAEKLEVAMKFHPQRKRQKQRHPNWGHPVLREIKKQLTYSSVEDVRNLFQRLHEEYPEVTIPCAAKMYVMIYSSKSKPPVEKWVLNIKISDDGGFYVEYVANTYKKTELPGDIGTKKAEASGSHASPEKRNVVGRFTSMVELKKKPAKQITAKPEEEEENK